MAKKHSNTARQLFNKWARNDHARGMERGHWNSVQQAFSHIPESSGNYLEIGFGNGYGIEFMAQNQYKNGSCYGIDISEEMQAVTKERCAGLSNVTVEAADFSTWQPPGDVRFSCIFSMEVFYYFDDIQKGIEKAFALLNPGGMLMVLVDFYAEHKESHTWPDDVDVPMTLWSEQEYRQGFLTAGFERVMQKRLNPEKGAGTLMTAGYRPLT